MKKPLFVAIVSLLALATLVPVYADITDKTWLGTTYTGRDDYYDYDVKAYESGTTAILAITVRNWEGFDINVTSVYVTFDWDATFTSTQASTTNPETLEDHEVRVFFINFQVPNTTIASNLYRHSYTIVVEYSYPNATNPFQILTGEYDYFGDDFVVYSADQADAMNLVGIIGRFSPPSPYGWSSVRAQILWNRAMNETNSGQAYYRQGDFQAAKERFSTALDHINQAWNAEEAYLTVMEELNIRQIEANIKNLDSMANFFNGLSTMWILFGIGGILFSIGYIMKWSVHARRHSKPEASA